MSAAIRTRHVLLGLLGLLAGATLAAPPAALPQRNLQVELRSVSAAMAAAGDEDDAAAPPNAGYTVSTRPSQPAPPQPVLLVLNGHWGALRFGQSLPVQWLQAGSASTSTAAASGAASGAQRSGGSFVQGLVWIEAGQGLAVRPRWPGGDQPVTLELRYDAAAVEPGAGAAVPATRHLQAGTTLRLPLGRWTTVARVAAAAPAAQPRGSVTWSTQPADATVPQALQVRVTVP
jgi:hypothetical protein